MRTKITLDDQSGEVTVEEEVAENLYGVRKSVDLLDLADLFASFSNEYMEEHDRIVWSCPILPNAGKSGLQGIVVRQNGANTYTWLIPSGIRSIVYYDEPFQVGFPPLLLIATIKHRQGIKSLMVALKDEPLQHTSPLYKYPYSNVFGNGSICWGNYQLPEVEEPDLTPIERAFLSLPSNDDLYRTANQSNLEMRELLERLSGQPFPEEWLNLHGNKYGELFQERG